MNFEDDDQPLDLEVGNGNIEESVVAKEPALNIGQAFFADIDKRDDDEVASKRMMFYASKMEGAIKKVKSVASTYSIAFNRRW